MRAWAEKYAGDGLVVVGVQTPEFEFEGDLDNVRRGIEELDVRYPVAVDNDYAVWQAFDNHYWPALYFVDAQGRIRHHHFGEGEYEDPRWSSRCSCVRPAETSTKASSASSRAVSRRRPTGPP